MSALLSAGIPNAIFTEVAMKAGIWVGNTPPTTFYDPVNFQSLILSPPKQSYLEVLSNIQGSVGKVIGAKRFATSGAAFKGMVNSMDLTLGKIILGADTTPLAQTGEDISAEAITTILNTWVPLAHQYISATGLDLKTTGGSPTTIDAAKYEVDLVNGMVKAIHADAVGAMTLDYTTLTVAGNTFDAGQAKQTNLQLIGHAVDASGLFGRFIIWRAVVSSSQDLDIAAKKFWEGTLEGGLVTPSDKTSPWEFIAYEVTS
jgi:hypothetical protein